MSFLASLAGYKKKSAEAARAAANPPPVKVPYKHPLHDKLEQVRVESTSNISEVPVLDTTPNGVTLMFMIIDALPFEAIWRIWLESSKKGLDKFVRIIIHAKYPDRVRSAWVRRHLCRSFQLKPEWGSVELTDTMVRLLNEAVNHEFSNHQPSSHFCYVSESCIPITTLERFLADIGVCHVTVESEKSATLAVGKQVSNQSWMRFTNRATNGYAQQLQFSVLKDILPSKSLYKADQWVLLSRLHALEILNLPRKVHMLEDTSNGRSRSEEDIDSGAATLRTKDPVAVASPGVDDGLPAKKLPILSISKADYESTATKRSMILQLFNKVRASDEMYIPCCLAILGYIRGTGATSDGYALNQYTSTTSQKSKSSSKKKTEENAMKIAATSNETSNESINIACRALTFVDWSEGGKSPKTFDANNLFALDVIGKARQSGCLFLRKVKLLSTSVASQVDFCVSWAEHILQTSSSEEEGEGEGGGGGEGEGEGEETGRVGEVSDIRQRAIEMLRDVQVDVGEKTHENMVTNSKRGEVENGEFSSPKRKRLR